MVICFTCFPLLIVLFFDAGSVDSPDALIAGVMFAFSALFLSPENLWVIPLGTSIVATALWRLFNMGRSPGTQ